MHKNKDYVLFLAGMFTVSGFIVSQPVSAQDMLQRIQSRIEAREEARDGTQNQNAPAQSSTPALPASNVSMVTLQTQTGPTGQQMVLTPKGYLVPLPGSGVNGMAVQIFMGSSGGYWYVDRNNQQVDLTADVQRMQANAACCASPSVCSAASSVFATSQ